MLFRMFATCLYKMWILDYHCGFQIRRDHLFDEEVGCRFHCQFLGSEHLAPRRVNLARTSCPIIDLRIGLHLKHSQPHLYVSADVV